MIAAVYGVLQGTYYLIQQFYAKPAFQFDYCRKNSPLERSRGRFFFSTSVLP